MDSKQQIKKYVFWYASPNKKDSNSFYINAFFNTSKGVVSIYPGLLVVTDYKTGQQLWETKLTEDIKLKRSFANVYITYLGGKSIPVRSDYRYYYCFHSSWWYLVSWTATYGYPAAKKFVDNLQQASKK